jgi:hypothetical protein
MIVEFEVACEIDVFENDNDRGTTEIFEVGDTAEFDIFEDIGDDLVHVQFGNGSVAFGLSKKWYKVLKN